MEVFAPHIHLAYQVYKNIQKTINFFCSIMCADGDPSFLRLSGEYSEGEG